MFLNKKSYILPILFCFSLICFSQNNYVVKNKKGIDKINFKLVNNVIIIPVEVNGVELSFLLDTGVSKPIVFNFLKSSDSLNIQNAERIYLKGLGNNGLIEALKSSNNQFKIGDAVNTNQDFYVVFDSSINFAPHLGVPIHGIIGYDFFKDLVVEINYSKKYLKIANPESYKYRNCKKCETLNLQFYNNKPYVNIKTTIASKNIPVKLLLDTGSSNSIWLFEDDDKGITLGDKSFDDFLGYGLSGILFGKRTKIDSVIINSFVLNNPKATFPDSTITKSIKRIKGRNGSLGGEILKRFNIVVDYKKAKIRLKKNRLFKEKFSYNKSGISLVHDGIRVVTEFESDFYGNSDSQYSNTSTKVIKAVFARTKKNIVTPAFSISQIRPNSPADLVGLKVGDVLISVNNKNFKDHTLQELLSDFFDEEGKKTKVVVERLGIKIVVRFELKSPLN
ncbi:aspartyl protease family protein [uncultured Lacinutrix sp.]|uniref:aspartyl protease family protein n=1 Tax=uncultured Lacinutrix sp. TaxID=574032 RepID=UPI0026333791|nr:aspartyl protease family protein [uncultured Lacinutrix sp.]